MALRDISPENSLITLPGLQQYQRTSDGLWVTEALGKAGIREVLLGSDGLTTSQFPPLERPRGFSFDGGTQQITAGTDAQFSFTDGVSDKPFSIAALVAPTSFAFRSIVSKAASLASGEYIFGFYTTGRFSLIAVDNTTAKYIGRLTAPNTLVAYVPQVVVGTYSGNGLSSGIKLYRDAVRVDTSDNTLAGYVRMRQTSQPLIVGRGATGSFSAFWGKMLAPMIFDFELSLLEIAALTHRMKYLYGVTP